jgi:hypothetical protein
MKNRFILPTLAFCALFAAACNLTNTNMGSNPTTNNTNNVDNNAPDDTNQTTLLKTLTQSNAVLSKNNQVIYDALQNIAAPDAELRTILNIGAKIQRFDDRIAGYLHGNLDDLVINRLELSQMYATIVDSMTAQNSNLKFATMLDAEQIESLSPNGKAMFLETIRFDALANYHDILAAFAEMKNVSLASASVKIMANSAKPAIVLGEEYRAEIALVAPYILQKYAITVNGGGLPVKEGRAIYRTRPGKLGEQKYTANITLTNPLTGELVKTAKDFYFNIAASMAFIQKEGSHVFYLGEDNELIVEAAGISSNDIGIAASGTAAITILPAGKSTYTVKAKQKGTASITITDKKTGRTLGVYPFEVKTR